MKLNSLGDQRIFNTQRVRNYSTLVIFSQSESCRIGDIDFTVVIRRRLNRWRVHLPIKMTVLGDRLNKLWECLVSLLVVKDQDARISFAVR